MRIHGPRLPGQATPKKVIEELFPGARQPVRGPGVAARSELLDAPIEDLPRFLSLDEALEASPASTAAATVLRSLAERCDPREYLGNAQRVLKSMGEPEAERVMRYLRSVKPLARAAKIIKTGPRGGKITGHRADGSPIYARNSSGSSRGKKASASKSKSKPHPLDGAHSALKAAAAAHVANPSEETAKALDDAHAALRSAASAHSGSQAEAKPKGKGANDTAKGNDESGAQGEGQGQKKSPATAPKPTPVDSEPLAPGEGQTPGEAAAGEPVSPQTPAAAGRAEAEALQAQVAEIHDKLQGVEHAISGELVPLYNALKADMRRLYKRPQQAPIGFLGQRVEAFVEMVTKVLQAGVSLATRMAKSERLTRYLARAGTTSVAVDDAPLVKGNRVIGFDPMLESRAFDLLEEVVEQLPAWLAAEAKVERLARIRDGMAKSCRYMPTASPLHRGEVCLPGGLMAMVEVPAGESRTGVGEDGRAWSSLMPVHYGEIEGTRGRDGDPIDVFLGPYADAAGPVWVSDVYDAQGRRAEDKVFIGFEDEDDVTTVIDFVYQPVRSRVSEPRRLTWDDFCAWAGRRPMMAKSDPLTAVEQQLDAILEPNREADDLVGSLLEALAEL